MSRLIVSFALVCLCVAPASANLLPPNYTDAPLYAVQFVDGREGWAVGDHGIIWHTIDSGRTWERQKSGTKASLRSICFVTPYYGWIAGRTELPNGAGSAGLLLVTTDGGATWTDKGSGSLPGLNYVKFFDETNGVAVGDGSDALPSGLFFTGDGGKTWIPGMGPRATSWMAASFTQPTNGIVGGIWSKICTVREGKSSASDIDSLGGRAIRGFASSGTNTVVAAAEGGTILTSANDGAKWTVANTGLSAEVSSCLDFHAVVSHGKTVWAAGKPGSIVLRSTDSGKTWERFATKWNAPIHALFALSENEVFAVGDLGSILASTDGGKTWKVQQCGGRNAGALFLHANGQQFPAEAMAMIGQKEGYFCAAMAMTTADPATAETKRCLDGFRLNAAVRAVGGTAGEQCWAFPVPSHSNEGRADQLLALWDAKHDRLAEDRLTRQLVLAIRMWKPEIVVTDRLTSAATPAEQLVLRAVRQAFKLAEDPNACPEHLEILGLAVFAPKKLYAVGPESGTECPVQIDATEFAKDLFDTPQSFAEPACAILGEGVLAPKRRCFRLVSHRLPGSEKHTSLMEGIDLPEGGNARRRLPKFNENVLKMLEMREKDTKTRAILEGLTMAPVAMAGADKTLPMIGEKLKSLPDDIACKMAVGLGRQLAIQGKWVPARELFLMVVAKYSQYPESVDAVRWLSKYYSSGEARRRAENENSLIFERGGIVPGAGDLQHSNFLEPVIERQQYRMTDPDAVKVWCKACLELEEKMSGFGTVYSADPSIQLTTISARRQLNLTGDAAKQLQRYFRNAPGAATMNPGVDAYRDCLAAEMWLLNPASITVQPKPLAHAPLTKIKPFLDGKLDDDCWRQFQPLELKGKSDAGALTGYTTKVYLAHDADFFYFAVECKHPEGKQAPKATKRLRDDDLRGYDRVDLMLDLDRDYQSYYRLQIDQRGCVADDCNGDSTWNPKWFVAVEPTPTGWTAEIAIPRTELTGTPFAVGNAWAWNVSRVVPGLGVHTWSGSPDAQPRPECMGLLKFVNDGKK